ncbi:MAG: radical SAM protein [Magnetococcales bacterium]|nr:radical SAM protein [Magnetococcales bacterium]
MSRPLDDPASAGQSVTSPVFDNAPLEALCHSLVERHRPNRRVLLIQVPQIILKSFNREVALNKGYYIFPPTGLQCLAASAWDRDLEFKILDMNFELLKRTCEEENFDPECWLDILTTTLDAFDPWLVGVSCMFDLGIESMMRILHHLQQRDRQIVITGGVIASYEYRQLLQQRLCHFVVQGEGENKFNFLLDCLTGEAHHPSPLSGIHFVHADQLQESQGATRQVANGYTLQATYDLIPIERYYLYGSLNPFSRMANQGNAPFAAIQLNRGCRAACTFCSVRDFMGAGVRRRSGEAVLEEMAFLIEQKGVRHFEWLDDDLLFDVERFKALLRQVIERRWSITWSANNGLIAGSIDAELLELMRASGCVGFKIGVESGNAAMLRKVRKPASLKVFRRVAILLEQTPEIFVGGNFLLGVPDETFGQMMDSFRLCQELAFDWAAMTVCQKIRGATAFEALGDTFGEQMSSGGGKVSNFIPSRESRDGSIQIEEDVWRNLQVFRLPVDQVPSESQVREIWFTFNLVCNFIFNRNLQPEGRVEKFITWVEMARMAYPANPYMCFFLALAYRIADRDAQAVSLRDKSRELLDAHYWQERFDAFGLTDLLERFPSDADATHLALAALRDRTAHHFRHRSA